MILELSSRKKVTRKPAITEHKSGKHLRAKPSIFEHDKAELSFNNNKNLCIFETKMWKAHIFLIFSSKKVKIFSCFGLKIHKSQTLLWFEPGSQSISAFLRHVCVHTQSPMVLCCICSSSLFNWKVCQNTLPTFVENKLGTYNKTSHATLTSRNLGLKVSEWLIDI